MTESAQSRSGDGGKILREFRAAKGFLIYATDQQLSGPDSVDWAGSLSDYLTFAKEVGAKVLYLSTWVGDEVEASDSADVELGFLLGDRFHVFSSVQVIESEPTSGGSEEAAGYLQKEGASVVSEVVDKVFEHPAEGYSLEVRVRELVQGEVAKRIGPQALPTYSLLGEDESASESRRALQGVEDQVVRQVKEREKPLVAGLYPRWLAFARQLGGHTLSKGDLQVFLDREKQDLTQDGRQQLWTQAKIDLQVERTAAKLAKSKRAPG